MHSDRSYFYHRTRSSPASSLALLPSSSHLLIGTSTPPALQILDVRSLQIIRTTALSETASSTASVPNLIPFYRPTAGDARGSKAAAKRRVVAEQLERAVKRGQDAEEDEDEVYWSEVPAGDAEEVSPALRHQAVECAAEADDYLPFPQLEYLTPPALLRPQGGTSTEVSQTSSSATTSIPSQSQSSAAMHDLQTQVDSLKSKLAQAEKWNKDMWAAVVAKGLNGNAEKA